jgi:hypothetical protein
MLNWGRRGRKWVGAVVKSMLGQRKARKVAVRKVRLRGRESSEVGVLTIFLRIILEVYYRVIE